ncbi:MAG: efflux RND transporter periplasmic adaptor subunit [Pirellulaceae bacterium]|nr:efflux RND transporter periplasmic adaptor subunit [Pirellulaceae bacterium]
MHTTIRMIATIMLPLLSTPALFAQAPLSRPNSAGPQGVLGPWKVCKVACAESGLVKELLVQPGQFVPKGQPLASLDCDQQELMIMIAQAHAKNRGKLHAAQADFELNRRKLVAVESGRSHSYTSQTELERARVELEISQGRLTAELEEKSIEELQIKRLENQLQQRTIVAPWDGTVVKLYKEVGEYVAPNTPEILEIVDTSRLRAVFYLTLAEARSLPTGPALTIEVDGQAMDQAELEYVAPVADAESGLIEVRALIANPSRQVMGSSCTLVLSGTGNNRA